MKDNIKASQVSISLTWLVSIIIGYDGLIITPITAFH